MTTITLPAHAYEEHLPDLLDCLGTGDDAAEIALDFLLVSFWTPGALVLLLAKVHRLTKHREAKSNSRPHRGG